MPIFALANAGVPLSRARFCTDPVALAVGHGALIVGKPLGIFLFEPRSP